MRSLAVLLTLVCLCLGAAPAAPAAAAEPTRVSVEVRGAGPDVLLIPGLASPPAVWDDTARRLAGRYRLHLVQVAGFAGLPAGPNADGPVLAPVVEALHSYLADRKLAHVAVIGHSMGGLMGLMLARSHPEDVGRLMVVDALPFSGVMLSPEATTAMTTPAAAQLRDNVARMTPEAFAAAEGPAMARMSITPEGQKTVLAWALASDRKVIAQASYDDLTTDVRADLPAIRAPITVVYAYAPAMGPAAQIDTLYKTSYAPAPDKRLVRVDGSMHFVPLDQPEPFAKAVADFLK